MHLPEAVPSGRSRPGAWWRELNRYHWFVFIVAALGWLFDTMDQQLFNLARVPAMKDLLAPGPGVSPAPGAIEHFGGIATMIFLFGWASGGLAFGILGDRVGRARVMLWTILIYSLFTGLSALSVGFWDFAIYRFLTGLGVGGEFAVGVSLVAEVMPIKARPFALGLLQASSGIGNITAAVASLFLFRLEESGAVGSAWRVMFLIGTAPALLAILIRRRLKEPEKWRALTTEEIKRKLGSYGELFGNPRWRRHALAGLVLAFAGVVGLWGIGFFSVDLTRSVFKKTFEAEARRQGEAERDQIFVAQLIQSPDALAKFSIDELPSPNSLLSLTAGNTDAEALLAAILKLKQDGKTVSRDSVLAAAQPPVESMPRLKAYLEIKANPIEPEGVAEQTGRIKARTKKLTGRLGFWASITSIMLNLGAMLGIYAFTYLTFYLGRKPAFAIALLAAMIGTILVFAYLRRPSDIFWMVPIMGFCQLSLFGGYAIYFPELFPTYLRSTGTSFCYNVGRFVAAPGPFLLGLLTSKVFSPANGYSEGMRWAGVTMSFVFLLGMAALPFLPETKGKPLPD
jgi:MFS family permease